MGKEMKIKKKELSYMRNIIKKKMTKSAKIPQFSLETKVYMNKILETRKNLNYYTSLNTCLICCCSRALEASKEINGFFLEEENKIGLANNINIGFAVGIKEGLIVPVIKNVNEKNLKDIFNEVNRLIKKAHNDNLKARELQDGTFTLSNLGMYDIKRFIPLINPPQLAIMSVGSLSKEKIIGKNGNIKVNKYINVNITADHRALDGVIVAKHLEVFKNICENEFERSVL